MNTLITECIDFVSNDFLGFSRSTLLNQEVCRRYYEMSYSFLNMRMGAGGSRLMVGASPLMQNLESKIAAYHGVQEAFIVNSGYIANLGFCYHVSQDDDILLWDEYVHMSVKYGLCATKGTQQSFRHNDLNHLETLLQHYRESSCGRIFIFICSVYSFEGTFAPLEEILGLAFKYDAKLIVDEAHAVGLFGKEGRGLCKNLGYENFYAILVTFGKALGCMGAAILSSKEVKENLMFNSPPLRYSTCLSPSVLVAIDVAYDFLSSEGEKSRHQLLVLHRHFQQNYPKCALGCVQPIYVNKSQFDSAIVALQDHNIQVGILTFRSENPFIRVNLHSFNTIEEIDLLISVLDPYLEKSCYRVNVDHKFHFWRELC
ncbi:aminotransferase class I/II-fold pyridoxal phosphate-dependent enzyme [Chlamydia sp. 17-3921]|uniref:aminotransferase class I/II-fold pyridoxal phosphate-dependent enzyme n=1 Tax=Chlamydia sp. 17-3921 TaxID=2675798 RepID=UPI001919DC82|nr:aminotransferase class I/II-fold pyridoxal phosphate-dependent enzyme [Chlamydia sp. 17-3921]